MGEIDKIRNREMNAVRFFISATFELVYMLQVFYAINIFLGAYKRAIILNKVVIS